MNKLNKAVLGILGIALVSFTGYVTAVKDNSYVDSYNAISLQKDTFIQKEAVISGETSPRESNPTSTFTPSTGLGVKGKPSIPWGGLSQDELYEQMKDRYSSLSGYFDQWSQYLGIENDIYVNNVTQVDVDKFRSKFKDNIGLITWHQAGAYWKEMPQTAIYGGTATCGSSGCGPTAIAIVASTMLHKYVTPVEVIMARDTYNTRHPGSNMQAMITANGTTSRGAHVISAPQFLQLIEDPSINGKSLMKAEYGAMDKGMADSTLDSGGMLILVAHAGEGSTGSWWTKSGHFMVVRDKQGDKYFTADGGHDSEIQPQSRGNTNNSFTWDEINNCGHRNQIIYITPGEGYEEYLRR